MAGSSLFLNLARAAKVVALLLFLLPWVTVSCSPDAMERMQSEATGNSGPRLRGPNLGSGIPVANASGLNMATGQVQILLPNAGPREQAKAPQQQPSVPIEIGVIAGAALILIALLATFLLSGGARAIGAIGAGVLAIGALCYSVFVSYPPAVRTALAANNPSGAGGSSAPTPDQIAQILSVKPEFAFYLVLLMLALAVLFNALTMRKPAAPVAAAAPGPGA